MTFWDVDTEEEEDPLDYRQLSTRELQTMVERGDEAAEDELARREAARKGL